MATDLTQKGSGLEPKWRRTWARMAMDLNQNGPFADCPTQTTQTKVIIIHKISARCDPHHIPFLPRPPLAQQEMPSIFQPILSSRWPQVWADFLKYDKVWFGAKEKFKEAMLEQSHASVSHFTDHPTQAKVIIIQKSSAHCEGSQCAGISEL